MSLPPRVNRAPSWTRSDVRGRKARNAATSKPSSSFGDRLDRLDLLIANAGTYGPREVPRRRGSRNGPRRSSSTPSRHSCSPSRSCRSSRPARGKLIAVSTKMGSIEDNTSGGFIAYRSSKAALNAAWRSLAIEAAIRAWSARCFIPAGCRRAWAEPPLRWSRRRASPACAGSSRGSASSSRAAFSAMTEQQFHGESNMLT